VQIRNRIIKLIDTLAGSLLCVTLGIIDYLAGNRPYLKPVACDKVKRILVIRPGGLGDMLILLPILKLLKGATFAPAIDVVCERRNLPVLALAGFEKNALLYDANPLHFLASLRHRRYDVVIDTEQFHHFSAVFARLSGAPVRIGFKISPRRNLLYTHLINYEMDGPEAHQFTRLLRPLGIHEFPAPLSCFLRDTEWPASSPDVDLPSGPYVAIHPGTTSRYKVWPHDRFVQLIQELHSEHALAAVLTGGSEEARNAQRIMRAAKGADGRVVSTAGKLPLAATAQLLRNASLFVGADSGIAHLAVALGTPTVVLFGASDHKKWGTDDERHRVVRQDVPCSPCFIFGYHKLCRTIDCMKQIDVNDVLTACRAILT